MAIRKNIEDREGKSKYYFDKFRNMELKYFTTKEFGCKCTSCKEKGNTGEKMDTTFLIKLDRARDISGVPFKINSGYRCELHNKNIGGVSKSSHMNVPCNASDIATPDSTTRLKILEGLLKAGFTRVGIGKGFIHVDSDRQKSQRVCWTYY